MKKVIFVDEMIVLYSKLNEQETPKKKKNENFDKWRLR